VQRGLVRVLLRPIGQLPRSVCPPAPAVLGCCVGPARAETSQFFIARKSGDLSVSFRARSETGAIRCWGAV